MKGDTRGFDYSSSGLPCISVLLSLSSDLCGCSVRVRLTRPTLPSSEIVLPNPFFRKRVGGEGGGGRGGGESGGGRKGRGKIFGGLHWKLPHAPARMRTVLAISRQTPLNPPQKTLHSTQSLSRH